MRYVLILLLALSGAASKGTSTLRRLSSTAAPSTPIRPAPRVFGSRA
jgi:hypothetical protein